MSVSVENRSHGKGIVKDLDIGTVGVRLVVRGDDPTERVLGGTGRSHAWCLIYGVLVGSRSRSSDGVVAVRMLVSCVYIAI